MRNILLVLLLLAGCVNSNYTAGTQSYNSGNYQVAFDQFKRCYEQADDAGCAYNAGMSLEQMGDRDNAKNWITLAARYGNSAAIAELTKRGWDVPSADLQPLRYYAKPEPYYAPFPQQQHPPLPPPPSHY